VAAPPSSSKSGRCRAPRIGGFLALIPQPLCLGSIELDDGSRVTGFLCAPGARWRARHHQLRRRVDAIGYQA
jgi:hypothetical protein